MVEATKLSLPGADKVTYTDYNIWQVSKELPEGIYELTANGQKTRVQLHDGFWTVLLLSPMVCLAAQALFDDYAKAGMEYYEATDKVANLVGQRGEFEDAKNHAEQMHEKCCVARLALGTADAT